MVEENNTKRNNNKYNRIKKIILRIRRLKKNK